MGDLPSKSDVTAAHICRSALDGTSAERAFVRARGSSTHRPSRPSSSRRYRMPRSGSIGALLRCPWTTAPHGHREGDTPQEEPWIPEERVPGDRMLVSVVRSINHTSLD